MPDTRIDPSQKAPDTEENDQGFPEEERDPSLTTQDRLNQARQIKRLVGEPTKETGSAALKQAKQGAQVARKALAQLGKKALAALIGPEAVVPLLVVVAIVVLIIAAVFVFALAGLGGPRQQGGTARLDVNALDQKNTQLLGSLASMSTAVNSFLKNPNVFNATSVVGAFNEVLNFKDDLPNKDTVVPKIEEITPLLQSWADVSPDQKKEVFKKLKELRSTAITGCNLSTDAPLLASISMNADDKRGMSTGKTRDINGGEVNLNMRIPCFLVFLAKNGFTINAAVVVKDHSKLTSRGTISPHFKGQAIDLFGINGVIHPRFSKRNQSGVRPTNQQLDDAFTPKACELMKFLKDNYNTLKENGLDPSQIFGPEPCERSAASYSGKYGRALGFENRYLGGHNSHVHVGF